MFSTAASRLAQCLTELLESQDQVQTQNENHDQPEAANEAGKAELEKTYGSSGLGSSFSSINNKSLNSNVIRPIKTKPSQLSL